jgi:hypothetical protein
MDTRETRKENSIRLSGSRAVFVYSIIAAIFAALFLAVGNGGELYDRVLSAILILLNSTWIPGIYLLGAMGLGRVARKWTRQLSTRWVIELGIGLTITLSLSHGLGVLGILNPIIAWLLTGLGCVLLAFDLRQYASQLNVSIGRTSITIPRVVFVLGCVLVVVMSLNPPGTLWDSEYGSYDALSYHLELPREWLESGRIWPSTHNVYSFLPSYFESAYLHFAHLSGAPRSTPDGLSGFLANDARVAMSTHLFSAMLVILSAIAMRSLAGRAIELYTPDRDVQDPNPALIARVLMVCTPWIIVVGSLAYNELGVVLLGICAITLVIEHDFNHGARSVLAAIMVGGACSCKPTAIFLLAPSVGVILLATIPIRQWWKPIILGSFVGLITISPWLVRNGIATGNIVFPQAASAIGQGHWTEAQHAVYTDAHQFEGSTIDRFLMLVVPDSDGSNHVSRHRGFTNLQWALTPWIGLIGCIVLLAQRCTHKLGAVISLCIALPMISWMMLTHLQSRFLIPLTPMLIGAGALAFTSIKIEQLRTRLVNAISMGACAWALLLAIQQTAGNPFMLIDLGSGVFTGEIEIGDAPWTATINSIAEPDETIYLIGDATPFYVRSPMIYNTVYDHWLIEDAINAHPDDPTLWTPWLRGHDIDIIVISFSEINRFAQSDWLPDTIDLISLNEWINSLPEPIYIWTTPGNPEPIRAAFRISP